LRCQSLFLYFHTSRRFVIIFKRGYSATVLSKINPVHFYISYLLPNLEIVFHLPGRLKKIIQVVGHASDFILVYCFLKLLVLGPQPNSQSREPHHMGCSRLLFNMCTATNVCNITNIRYVRKQSPCNTRKLSFTTFDSLFTRRVVLISSFFNK